MNVLVACEFSGAVRDAFRRLGHQAWSCDLPHMQPEGEFPQYHYSCDVLELLYNKHYKFDLMIGHPPCTYLANSGARWLYGKDGRGTVKNEERWQNMRRGAEFFLKLWNAPVEKIAIENPVMHSHGRQIIGQGATQIIQPWQFGHGETKATCLWLKNLPRLKPTNIVSGREQRVHKLFPGPERWKERSRTFLGVAKAMAEQWGK